MYSVDRYGSCRVGFEWCDRVVLTGIVLCLQALLMFWYVVCSDCPENIELITSNPHVCKNIAFNYIL